MDTRGGLPVMQFTMTIAGTSRLVLHSFRVRTCAEPQLVHACLQEMNPRVFLVSSALAELNTREITRITCVHRYH